MSSQLWVEELLRFFEETEMTDDRFNGLALRLFDYQYKNNKAFQAFCLLKGKTARTVKHWKDIPAVPVNGFKELPLSCTDPELAEAVFMTSGTTNQDKRGKHYHPTLRVYDQSMLLNFKKRIMGDQERIRMGVLFPSEQELPHSSLAHYLALALREFGTPDSKLLIKDGGLDQVRLMEELEQAERSGKPYMLIGATSSFVHMFDFLQKQGRTFRLPEGSRMMDTGGIKGKSREMGLEEFYNRLSLTCNVSRNRCLNMYGMSELSTQFYDNGNDTIPSVKSGPHWIRTRVVNPLTGEDVPEGQTGVITHCDLANFNSVTTILTEDAGRIVEGGFQLFGRVKGAEAKGCSLALDEYLNAAKGTL